MSLLGEQKTLDLPLQVSAPVHPRDVTWACVRSALAKANTRSIISTKHSLQVYFTSSISFLHVTTNSIAKPRPHTVASMHLRHEGGGEEGKWMGVGSVTKETAIDIELDMIVIVSECPRNVGLALQRMTSLWTSSHRLSWTASPQWKTLFVRSRNVSPSKKRRRPSITERWPKRSRRLWRYETSSNPKRQKKDRDSSVKNGRRLLVTTGNPKTMELFCLNGRRSLLKKELLKIIVNSSS